MNCGFSICDFSCRLVNCTLRLTRSTPRGVGGFSYIDSRNQHALAMPHPKDDAIAARCCGPPQRDKMEVLIPGSSSSFDKFHVAEGPVRWLLMDGVLVIYSPNRFI